MIADATTYRLQDYAVFCLERWLGFPLHRKGARAALRESLSREDEDGDYESMLSHGCRVPDAWFVIPREARMIHPAFRHIDEINADRFVWIEVEDTSKLTTAKLDWYAELWFDCDCTLDTDFQVATTDRYGRDFRFVDLQTAWAFKQARRCGDTNVEQGVRTRVLMSEQMGYVTSCTN